MKTILPLIGGDNNEAPELKFSRLSVLKDAQGLSLRSSASLYRRTQSSTPCAMLANSLDSTFISKYSIIAGGSSTVIASVHVYLPPSAPGELIAQMNSDARKMAFTIFHSLADRR